MAAEARPAPQTRRLRARHRSLPRDRRRHGAGPRRARAGRWASTSAATVRAPIRSPARSRTRGGTALALGADVADAAAADEMLAQLTEELGPVLVLVNNAGMTADALSMRLSDEDWTRVLDVNLTAAFRLTRAALGPMMRQRFGRVINVSSVVGLRANPGPGQLRRFQGRPDRLHPDRGRRGRPSRSHRERGGPRADRDRADPRLHRRTGRAVLLDGIPARRPGSPEEVAACIRFLASDEASLRDRGRAAHRRRHVRLINPTERKEDR